MARKFQVARNLGRSVAYSSVDVVSNLMPNTTDLVRGIRSGSDYVRDILRKNTTKIRMQSAQMDRSLVGRKARALFEDAWKDIRQGNLALGDISDQSMSDWEDFNSPSDIVSYSDQKMDDGGGTPTQGGATASAFKSIAAPEHRTVQGIQQLGNTLGNVTLKGLEYQTQSITNAILTQMSFQDEHFKTMEKQLDVINKNLVQLVNFHNESTNRMYQANLAFYDQMSNWIKKYEKRQENMNRTTRGPKTSRMSRFLGSSLFDFDEYGKIVKDNLAMSPLGMIGSMLGFVNPDTIGLMLGGKRGKFQPQNLLLNAMMMALIPKQARRSMTRLDSQANSMAKTMLTRLGNMQYQMDQHPILGLLGSIFGIDGRMNRTLRLGQYKKGAMSWNGEAQKALTVVIPKELAEIKAAILKQDARYYDATTGSYVSKKDIKERTRRAISNATESPFANIFNRNSLNPDDVADRRYWSSMEDEVKQEVSRIVNEAVRSSAGMTTELMRALDETISKGISSLNGTQTDVQRMAMELNTAVNQARSDIENSIAALQDQNSAFSQIAVDMANEYGNINFETLMDYIGGNSIDLNAANGGAYTLDGRRLDMMSPDERRRYENNLRAAERMRDRASRMSSSRNRFVRTAGKVYNRYVENKTNPRQSRYSRKFSGGIDALSNKIYRVVMKGEPLRPNQDARNAAAPGPAPGPNPRPASSSFTRNRYAEDTRLDETIYGQRTEDRPTIRLRRASTSRDNETGEEAPRRRTGGGIQNEAMQRENRNDPVENMAEDIKEQRKVTEQAWGIKGYMSKVFNSPIFQKFLNWLENTPLGKATKSVAGKAGSYIKDIFTKDYTDEEGNTTESVKTRLKGGIASIRDYVLNFLGINKEDMDSNGAKVKQKGQSFLKFLNDSIRKKAPKHLVGGIIGAAAGASMGGSTGLLGSLILPGGPIGGAIVGMGVSILSESETFKRIMFGEKGEDGQRTGGIISQELQKTFKKVAPSLGLGALAGVALKFLGSAILPSAVTSTIGFFPSIFLPGGVMGAAILGAAGGFALHNKRVQDALFGKADDNGKRSGTIFSNLYNKVTGKIKSANDSQNKATLPKKILNGIKGAIGGGIAASVIGQLGLVGALATPGGPIGAAIIGAAVSIMGAGTKFDQYLFGTKDGDKRKKDGLFSRLGNMLQLHVFEPVSQYIASTAEELVWHARSAIEVPFRLAIGPIVDSFADMRDSMKETATGTIKSIGEKIGNGVMKILNPIGKTFINLILKPIGKVAGGLIKGGLFAGASMIGAPFQLLSLLTSKKRRKGEKLFGDFLNSGVKDEMLGKRWARQQEEGEESNQALDRFMYNLATLPGIGKFFRNNDLIAEMAEYYGETEEGQGRNTLDWLGAKADRKHYKSNLKDAKKDDKQERRLNRLRQRFGKEDKYVEDRELSAKEFKDRQKRLKKLGIEINTQEELRQFTYHYNDWKNPSAAENAQGQKLSPEGEIQNETKGLIEKILEKLGIIVDLQRGALDVETGAQADTEDIDAGDVAETVDEDLANKIQGARAKANAQALGNVLEERDKKKKREEEHEKVTGNTSGNADDGDMLDKAANGEIGPEDVRDDLEKESKSSGGILGTLGSLLGGGGGLLGIVGRFFTSKAGIIALLGGGLAAILSNPDMRTALGNILGDAGSWIADNIKGAVSSIPNAVNTLVGSNGGVNDQRVAEYDENGNPTKTVTNTGLIENVVTAGAKDASTIAKTAKASVAGGSGVLSSIVKGVSKTGVAKVLKRIPGVSLATDVVKGTVNAVKSGGKAVSTVASKVKSLVEKAAGTKAGQAVGSKAGSVVKTVTKNGKNILQKALDLLTSALDKAVNTKLGAKAAPVLTKIATFFKTIATKVAPKLLGKHIDDIVAAITQAGAKVASYLIPGVNIISAVITAGSAISGLLNPERLFKVSADYVDGTMRLIGTIFNLATSATGIGAVLSVINDIVVEFTGMDMIQNLALTLYHAIANDKDDAKIEEAVKLMDKEVEIYNKEHGTNLSVDAYNDLKNKGTWGSLGNSFLNLFGAGDKTDYSKYEDQARAELGLGTGKSAQKSTDTSKSSTTKKSNNQAIGYGPSTSRQDDPRWGSLKIGYLPNGQKATMANAGCGPTALANAASAVGLGYVPPDVAQMASQRGYLTNGGANTRLFDEGASDLGLDSTRLKSSGNVRESIRQGKPVILAGKSSGGNNPYTSSGHIVTATGLDENGNVIVQDPMRGTEMYDFNDLTSNMTHAWSISRKKSIGRGPSIGYGALTDLLGGAFNSLATSGMASVISKLTGMSYENAKAYAASSMNDSSSSTGSTGSVASTGSADVNLTGNTQAEQIHNYLKNQGYTDAGAAGIMGCWQIESSNRSDRVEGDYLKSFPGFQSVLASNKALDDYTTNVLFPAYARSNISINKNAYKGADGHYYPGIGLAQWTGSRGQQLFDYANQNNIDWRNLSTQLAFFNQEMANRGLKSKINAAGSAADAAHVVLDGYEMYEGYGAKAPSALKKRQDAANSIFAQYSGSVGNGPGTSKLKGKKKGAVGYGLLDTLLSPALEGLAGAAYKLFGLDYNSGESGTGTSDGATANYTATGNASKDQQALVNQMASIYGTLDYSLDGSKQDPDKAFTQPDGSTKHYASCASTVAWAYDKVLGFKPGGSGFASSTSQSKDSNFTTIYTNDGKNLVDVSKLQPGDILYQNWSRTSNDGNMKHTEMYAGCGRDLSHGGPGKGPVYKDLTEYRKKHTMMVRRYTPFIASADASSTTDTDTTNTNTNGSFNENSGAGRGDSTDAPVGNGLGMRSHTIGYGVGPRFCASAVGQHVSNPNYRTVGYGPGTSTTTAVVNNKGVETRLDTIIQLMSALVNARKSIGNGPSTTNNLTVNNVKTEKAAPPIIVNQTTKKSLGEDDAAHEFLRTRYRKIASASHA